MCVYFLPLGVGVSMMLVSMAYLVYYIQDSVWLTQYLLDSFKKEPPWTHCNHEWSTDGKFKCNTKYPYRP